MKKKNIFSSASLKVWLAVIAIFPAFMAVIGVPHTKVDPAPSGSVADNLEPITSLSISYEDFKGGEIEARTYYDNKSWYNYASRSVKSTATSMDWKIGQAIAFRLDEGDYILSVDYTCSKDDSGLWVYEGNAYLSTYDEEVGISEKGSFSGVKEIPLAGGKIWWVSGINDTFKLRSISIKKEGATTEPEPLSSVFPSDIDAINSNTFWYHNNGDGIGFVGSYGSFYRYLVNKSGNFYAPTSTNMISINGTKNFKSYELKKGEAIGFMLAPYNDNDEYRIKLYYYSEGAPAVLRTGTDVKNAVEPPAPNEWSESSLESITTVKDKGGIDTKTRIATYHVRPTENTVYWVKNNNTDDQSLYLGGFEILTKNNGSPTGEFTGSWYVEDQAVEFINSIDDKETVVGSIAQSHDGVVTDIVTMPINDYEAITGRKSVMINWGSRIGVNIPAGATLTFSYTAETAGDGISIKDGITISDKSLSTDADATSNYNKYNDDTYKGEVSYTNNTGSTETVWIQGMSANYAYFSGFTVTSTVSINSVKPIESDYVWYPVKDKALFADNSLTDEHTFVVHGFNPADDDKTINKISTITFNSSLHTAYRPERDTQIGFKIAQGKKGVINVYYDGDPKANIGFPLYRSDDGIQLGKRITDYTVVNLGNDAYIAQYYFDTTNDQTTYWLNRHGSIWFGGFEVLFEDSNNGGVDLANGAYYCNGTSTVKNALGNDTYNILKSSNSTPVVGPSMIVNPLTEGNGVMLYTRNKNNSESDKIQNAIMFRMTGSTYNAVEVVGVVDGSSIRIYNGDPLNGGKLLGTLSSTGGKTIDLGDHTDADVFYAVSDDAMGAYLLSLAPASLNGNQLVTIDDYNIYRVNNQPYDGQILNDKHTIFIGGVDQVIEPGMMVLGQQNKAFKITNGQDFYGFKVGESIDGKKTGYIKVYFNGGTSDSHVMEELPLDVSFNAGWSSSYDQDNHIIRFNGGGGGRGWWFGEAGAGARDLSKYNKINIELGEITGSPNLQVVVQSSNGAYAAFPLDSQGRLLGDLTDKEYWHPNNNTGATFDIRNVSQIYIQDNNTDDTASSVVIKSARLMNKPLVIATGTIGKDGDGNETYDPANRSEVFGGIIHDVQDAHVYAFPFDLTETGSNPQLYWVTGDINIAAIEVVYDDVQHAKVVEWYVNKDTKMIVGSDDPGWVWTDFDGNKVEYPKGYDEYVTFYMSSGRQANVSFIMPEAVREVYDWEQALKANSDWKVNDDKLVEESASLKASYGKHTIIMTTDKNDYKITLPKSGAGTTYNRNLGQSKDMDKISGELYSWYSYAYNVPNDVKDLEDKHYWVGVVVTASQMENGSESEIEKLDGKDGQWKIYMRFVAYQAPTCNLSDNYVSVAKGDSDGPRYYTLDSSEPENFAVMSEADKQHSSTEQYSSKVSVSGRNCIFKAAQYIETPYQFYTDCSLGENSPVSQNLKLVSKDLAVNNEDPNVVYVQDAKPDDGKAQLFNKQEGGYMLTIPTGDKIEVSGKNHEQAFNPTPNMYLTLGGKDWPYLNGLEFNLCGTNWKASDDSGLKTYLDSYKYKFDVESVKNIAPWATSSNQNQNPYTEVNGGPGGSDTEDGGMFLQPIAGTMLRFEPEYDGVVTVWLRQNGCLDNNTQENGKFNRRPVFIMDENGRLMRRSTIKPTDTHYLGINGTYAINSSVCEERSQVENTWLHAVAKQAFADNPLYGESRFGADFPNRWETDGLDHAGHIMYGWWYKGFSLDATRSSINSASHVSRYEYMEPELLYRSDKVFDMEMNTLGLNNSFARYGYELPNFQYVRYRIPVKAGKTYYIAGRGTKNGFSAVRFDPIKANTNGKPDELAALRYSDNPWIVENSDDSSERYLKPEANWNGVGNSNGNASVDEMKTSYNSLTRVHIYEDGTTNYANSIKPEIKYDMDGLGNLVGQTVDVQLHRTFTAGYWHPIIVPFSVSETRLEQYFGEGTKVLYLDPYQHTIHNKTDNEMNRTFASVLNPALENSKLYFTYHRYQMLYANTPAFICPTFKWSDEKKAPATNNVHPIVSDGVAKDIIFKRVTLDGSNSRNDKGNGLFGYDISNDYEVVGTYDQTEEAGDLYYVTNVEGKAQLIHSKGDNGQKVLMRGTRVWIRPKQTAVNPAPIRTVGAKDFTELDFDFGNDEAGINDIVNDDITVERYAGDSGVYDLLGRKIAEDSLEGVPAGVYIFNGKKVYVN